MLHRLEGADAAAELLALLHVGDGHVEHRPGDADELGGGGRGGVVEGPARNRGGGGEEGVVAELGGHREEPAGAIDRPQRLQGEPVLGHRMERALTLEHDQVGGGVGDVRRACQSDGDGGVARGDPRQPLGAERVRAAAGEQRRADGGGLEEGLGEKRATRLLEDEDEVDLVHSGAAVLLGDGVADDPEVGELPPALRRAAALRCPGGAHRPGGALAAQQVAHRVAQQVLLGGEVEVHAVAYSRGRPSTRWAMMFFCTSEVPAKIVLARAYR